MIWTDFKPGHEGAARQGPRADRSVERSRLRPEKAIRLLCGRIGRLSTERIISDYAKQKRRRAEVAVQ